jgi:hypothetical protein
MLPELLNQNLQVELSLLNINALIHQGGHDDHHPLRNTQFMQWKLEGMIDTQKHTRLVGNKNI